MIINHNLNALNSHRQMGINNTNSGKAMEKLSSGLRINRAGDDAAGLAISEKMRAQVRGLDQASRNSQDGISMIQTAEGALNETHSILQRMRELAVQSANDTNVTVDRDALQSEMDELAKEITRIANDTEFNTQTLLNGGLSDAKIQVGANKDQNISISILAMDAFTLGVAAGTGDAAAVIAADGSLTTKAITTEGIDITSSTAANTAIDTINSAIVTVSTERSKLGANQNRLEHTINNLNTSSENLTAAESRIRDVDMAKEMMNFSKNNILNQAAQAMLAQANQQPQNVLQLLR